MRDPHTLIDDSLAPFTDLFAKMEQIITRQRAFDLFKALADIPAPSLTVNHTRAPELGRILSRAKEEQICGPNLSVDLNYRATGNVLLSLGTDLQKPIWSMAHLDNISFLTGVPVDEQDSRPVPRRYPLTAYCTARQTEGRRPAQALAFSLASGGMETIAHGRLVSEPSGHYFESDGPVDLPLATRIVYSSSAAWDRQSGMVTGTIDNAFGCVALILGALVLSHYDVQSLFVLTDEEEGVVAAGPPAFSRGATRLLNRLTPEQFPNLITISDHHEEVADLMQGEADFSGFGKGALFGAFASGTKGGVTPPRLLAFQHVLAGYLAEHQIRLRENCSYVSRSDCVTAMMATPNVALVGYPGAYSHFIDTPRAHIDDLVDLAKTLVIYHLVAQNPTWRRCFLGV